MDQNGQSKHTLPLDEIPYNNKSDESNYTNEEDDETYYSIINTVICEALDEECFISVECDTTEQEEPDGVETFYDCDTDEEKEDFTLKDHYIDDRDHPELEYVYEPGINLAAMEFARNLVEVRQPIDNEDPKYSNETLPSTKSWNLLHYTQTEVWDCGTSCILMVLPIHARKYIIENHYDFHMEEQFGYKHGIWTIDLVYVLKRFNVPFIYYTNTIGHNPGTDKIVWYERWLVRKKQNERVKQKFYQALKRGVIVELNPDISMYDIIKHLGSNGPVILLVDARFLYCQQPICDENSRKYSKFLCPCYQGYAGHYIVLIGYDKDKKIIMFRDPEKFDRVCHLPMGDMDKARTSIGTNNDVVFVFLDDTTYSEVTNEIDEGRGEETNGCCVIL